MGVDVDEEEGAVTTVEEADNGGLLGAEEDNARALLTAPLSPPLVEGRDSFFTGEPLVDAGAPPRVKLHSPPEHVRTLKRSDVCSHDKSESDGVKRTHLINSEGGGGGDGGGGKFSTLILTR